MITLNHIGHARNCVNEPTDFNWGDVISYIVLNEDFPDEALNRLQEFSHVEILYYFDKVDDSKICLDARHPRNNNDWPKVGIFAQRGKNRPNKIGATICEIVSIDRRVLKVKGLDAINNTPIIDIKPVFMEYLPSNVKQPSWVSELMEKYW